MSNTNSARTLLDDISALVSLPEVVQRLNQAVNEPDSTATDIARIISQDPGLTTRLLKIANSPMYGTSRKIDNINRAVTLLGTKQIRDLAYSSIASKLFAGVPSDIISVEDFWHHSLYCGLLARELATASGKANADTVFTAGLLHDIGQLILIHRLPQQVHEAILLMIQGEANKDLVTAEHDIIGFDHTEVGAELARNWHLPDVLYDCIAYHHTPAKSTRFPLEVAMVYVANMIAGLPYSDFPEEEDLKRIDANALKLIGLSKEQLNVAIRSAQSQINQTLQTLFDN